MSGVPWTEYEETVMLEDYQSGGWKKVQERLPHRSKKQICQKAFYMKLTYKAHLRGRRNGGRRRKSDAECAPYKPSPSEQAKFLEAMRLCGKLQDFGYITHKGQLRPMVRVELEVAA